MKLLYAYSVEMRGKDLIWALIENNIEVELYPEAFDAYEQGEKLNQRIAELKLFIKDRNFDGVISWNYFPVVSECCESMGIPYMTWIFDSPLLHVYSSGMVNSCNYIFAFDRKSTENIKGIGGNAYYMPLAVNTTRLNALEITEDDISQYSGDIAFVGSLYQNNLYNYIYFPQEISEHMNHIFSKQTGNWHNEYIKDSCADLEKRIELRQGIKDIDKYPYINQNDLLYGFFLARKMGEIERTSALNLLASQYNVTLYNSQDDKSHLHNVLCRPAVEYETEAPKVFFSTKINLNITLRSIETGIPLRAYDIMGVGGFLLTNYQEEFNELYEPGKDMVMYSDFDEMMDKAGYYLTHEKERLTIAMNGYRKTCACHTMKQRGANP